MKNAKPRREAGFRENDVVTGFSVVFAKPHNAAKSGALEQESYVSGSNTRVTGSGGRSIPQNPSKIKGFRAFPLDLKSSKKRSKTSMSTKCLPNFRKKIWKKRLMSTICARGGIGRRARFRFWSGQLGGGSSPLGRTSENP